MELKLDRAAPAIYKDCVTSTNTLLKGLAASGLADGFTLAAAQQTSGRGRLGRSFESPEGGLYMSMLLYPGRDLQRAATLTPCAAVAVCRAINNVCGVMPQIKWPNDLQLDGKKLCGILTEASSVRGRAYVVIGIGINLNTEISTLPAPLCETAISLADYTGKKFDNIELATAIINELDRMYAEWKNDSTCCLAEYRSLCASIGHNVTLIQGDNRRAAFVRDVDESYALIADINGEEEHISMGEISLRDA